MRQHNRLYAEISGGPQMNGEFPWSDEEDAGGGGLRR